MTPAGSGQRGGIDAGTGHDGEPQVGHGSPHGGDGVEDAAQERLADPGSTDRDDAHPLVGPVAELGAEAVAVGVGGRVEPGDVAGEVELALGPVADGGQVGAEGVGHDVVRVADEDRSVAQPAEPGSLLDHLRVVVGGERGFGRAAGGHREPADEVGHPGEREALELGVLVQEVVDLPRLVADDEVVVLGLDDVVEHHEVVDQDLVHPADGLEGVEVVLGALVVDVGRLAGQPRRTRVDAARRRRRAWW